MSGETGVVAKIGRWLTRDERLAFVGGCLGEGGSFPWFGFIVGDDRPESWTDSGTVLQREEDPGDLIEYLGPLESAIEDAAVVERFMSLRNAGQVEVCGNDHWLECKARVIYRLKPPPPAKLTITIPADRVAEITAAVEAAGGEVR